MARGDIFIFNEALAYQIDGGWESTDVLKCAVLDNTTAPAITTVTPTLGDFTEVTAAGTYTVGGTSIGTLGDFVTQSGAVAILDSTTNPTWAADASNDVDAHWALIYNDTQGTDPAWFYIDLGGPVDMTAGPLTINWNVLGVARLTA